MRTKLKAVTNLAEQSAAVAARVRRMGAVQNSRAVSVYLPIAVGGELDTMPLLESLFTVPSGHPPRVVMVPRITGDAPGDM